MIAAQSGNTLLYRRLLVEVGAWLRRVAAHPGHITMAE